MFSVIVLGGLFVAFLVFTGFCIWIAIQSKLNQKATLIGKFIYYYGTIMCILLGVAFFSCFAGGCMYLAGKFLIGLLLTK